MEYSDEFFIGHDVGDGSLDDIPALFAGRFNFHKTNPWAVKQTESSILKIYELLVIQRRQRRQSVILQKATHNSGREVDVKDWVPEFQKVVVSWFKIHYGDHKEVMLQQLKQFIMASYLHASSRVKLFKYFYTEKITEYEKEQVSE